MFDSNAYTAAAAPHKTQGARRYATQLIVPCIYGDEPYLALQLIVSRSEARAPANLAHGFHGGERETREASATGCR